MQNIRDELGKWVFKPSNEDKTSELGRILRLYDFDFILDTMYAYYSDALSAFALHIKKGNFLKKHRVHGRRIALYHQRYSEDGVGRVLSLLIPMYLQNGYEVVLLTDEAPSGADYPLPISVKRYQIIPEQDVRAGRCRYLERGREIRRIVKEEGIDVFCCHHSFNSLLFYDLLTVRSLGCKFILSKHEMFSQGFAANNPIAYYGLRVYPLLDALTVLSKEEELFWKSLNVRCFFLENPVSPVSRNLPYEIDSKHIVWVGRLDDVQKQYSHLVPIMELVLKEEPGCVLDIYGKSGLPGDEYRLGEQISKSGLDKSISYHGFSTDLEQIYGHAALLLLTSAFESSPMVVCEGKSAGLPIVAYRLPYVEMLKDKRGVIEVEQGDIPGAASAIIRILQDRELRQSLHEESRRSLEEYHPDVMGKWNRIFADLGEGREDNTKPRHGEEESLLYNIFSTMAFHQFLGAKRHLSLAKRYEELDWKWKRALVKKKLSERNLELALYPYGTLGHKVEDFLAQDGINAVLAIDERKEGGDTMVLPIRELGNIHKENYLFVICSDNKNIYHEIRENIHGLVREENIFDWFPLNLGEN